MSHYGRGVSTTSWTRFQKGTAGPRAGLSASALCDDRTEASVDATSPRRLSSSTSSPSSVHRVQIQEKLTRRLMIGQEAMAQRAISNGDSWMTAFIRDRWDCVPGSLEFDRLRSYVRRCLQVALADVGTGDALQKPGQGIRRGGSRTKVVNHQERVRAPSSTRQGKRTRMPELGYELH